MPISIWLSSNFARTNALNTACLRQRAAAPAMHDNFFHTVLGLLDVKSAAYEPGLDLTGGCRSAPN